MGEGRTPQIVAQSLEPHDRVSCMPLAGDHGYLIDVVSITRVGATHWMSCLTIRRFSA